MPVLRKRNSMLKSSSTESETITIKEQIKKPKIQLKENPKQVSFLQNLPIPQKQGVNLISSLNNFQYGIKTKIHHEEPIIKSIVEEINNLEPYATRSPFETRITDLEWHPKYSNILVAGSKWGDIYVWNTDNSANDSFTSGIGAGGSVTAIKVHKEKCENIYVSSMTAEIKIHNVEYRTNKTLFHANGTSHNNWFLSLDLNVPRNLLVTGDCKGDVYLTNCDGHRVWTQSKSLHVAKVTHTEFHPTNRDLLVTASLDNVVKIWDLRRMTKCLFDICHDKAINSACFSKTNGNTLLVTDQYSTLYAYQGPFWEAKEGLYKKIPHPHRQFQYLTPIKASWHPFLEIAIIGRYPHDSFLKGDKRTVDFYDISTGKLLSRLCDSVNSGIVSLNMFNQNGECLASAMGSHIILWKSAEEKERKLQLLMQNPLNHKLLGIRPASKTRINKPKVKSKKM